MSHSTLGMISANASGSDTRRQSVDTRNTSSGKAESFSSRWQKDVTLRYATLRMARAIKRVPLEVANRWYAFTRSDCHKPHILGSWVDMATAFAKAGAPLTDVMSPVSEVELRLKREVYRAELPSLEAVEAKEADVECALHKAEISNDVERLREAAREQRDVAEVLEQVADRLAHNGAAR